MATAEEHIKGLNLNPPGIGQQVYKDDCAYCFDTPESANGLDVCLQCFLSSSPDPAHNYTNLHYELTGHTVYMNIKKTLKKPKERSTSSPKFAKLAIEADKEEDHYDTEITVKDITFPGVTIDNTIVGNIIDGVLNATSYAKREEIQAWELEITPCEHVLGIQQESARNLESQALAHCSMCDLQENLWLCLTCGNLGCGRAQFGGVGGNSHALDHYRQTGCPASVKLGSITPEGTADIYCYQCDEERKDPKLAEHLKNWGIDLAGVEKTEKSLTELQLEQNIKWDFSMTSEDGKALEPVCGPELTGMRNLGNSCYLSTVVQCMLSLPQFQKRFYHDGCLHKTTDPANDLEVQMCKLADGLLSGRYSIPDDTTTVDTEPKHQKGISPGMFKALIGRGHPEFSTMRQQDAFEFWGHLSDKISASSKKTKQDDPTLSFKFQTEQRLECLNCHKVRYRQEDQENLSIPVPARRIEDNGEGSSAFETIQLKECFDLYAAKDSVDYKCKTCGSIGSSTQTLFKSFPDVLVLNARRFQIVNWVPTKLDIPVEVSDKVFSLDGYQSAGPNPDHEDVATKEEEEEDEQEPAFTPDPTGLSTLEAMGFPTVRCEKALYNTGNSDVEAAANWLFSHMEDPDIDVPMEFGKKKQKSKANDDNVSDEKIAMLGDMGFGPDKARKALKETGGNVEAAVEWVFSNPDDDGVIEEEDGDDDEESTPPGDPSLPANYKLKGIICHKGGSIHVGHYVAFVKKEGNWYLFNDEKVVKGGEIEEMKKYAYIYLFERTRGE